MKLSYSLLFAAVSAQDSNPIDPLLDQLEAYCIEAVYFKVTPKGVPCGTFDSGYQPFFPTQPPARDPCLAYSEVSSEFQRFINTFLTNDDVCDGTRSLKLDSRMTHWARRLTRRSDCDSYQYKGPSGAWTKIDNLCDSTFEDQYGANCTTYADPANNKCNEDAEYYLGRTERTSNGFATGLNCPECGCATNPTNLYDLPW